MKIKGRHFERDYVIWPFREIDKRERITIGDIVEYVLDNIDEFTAREEPKTLDDIHDLLVEIRDRLPIQYVNAPSMWVYNPNDSPPTWTATAGWTGS